MQLVHTLSRRGEPSTIARTRWMLGSQRRLFRLCENVTDFPNHGFLPQISQMAAIRSTRLPNASFGPGRPCGGARGAASDGSASDPLEVLVELVGRELAVDLPDGLAAGVVEDRDRLPEASDAVAGLAARVEHVRVRDVE